MYEVEAADKDKVFGVKVGSDLHEKLEDLFEVSGYKTKKEWMESVALVLSLQSTKENRHFSKDIGELELHTRRVVEIFANMASRTTHERDEEARRYDELMAAQNETIESLRAENADAKMALKLAGEDIEALKRQFDVLQRQANQYEEAMGNQAKLIESLEKQRDDLSAIVSEYKKAADENKVLHARVGELSKEIEQVEREAATVAERLGHKIGSMEQEQERLVVEHERAITNAASDYDRKLSDLQRNLDRAEKEHKRELETLKSDLNRQSEAAVAAKEVEWREKAAEIREEYQAKLQNSQEEAALRISELYKALMKGTDDSK